MTTTERTPALSGDEAAEQRSAPNLDAGVVGDLANELEALVTAVTFTDPPTEFNGVLCHEARVPVEFITMARAALAKYATQGTGGFTLTFASLDELAHACRGPDVTTWADFKPDHYKDYWRGIARHVIALSATHQPAISTDIGPFSQEAKIPGGEAANGAADHEGAGE